MNHADPLVAAVEAGVVNPTPGPTLAELHEIVSLQDAVLLAIDDGLPIPLDDLRSLPPWRAVMCARVAERAGALDSAYVQALVTEASEVGGGGQLRARLNLTVTCHGCGLVSRQRGDNAASVLKSINAAHDILKPKCPLVGQA